MRDYGNHVILIALLLNACTPQNYKPSPLPVFMQAAKTSKETKTAIVPMVSEPKTVPNQVTDALAQAKIREYNLNQVIQTALTADPVILAAFENINQAEADLITAGLLPNPDVGFSGSLLPLNRAFTVDRQGGPPQIDFGVAMPIDWFLFGKRAAAINSGKRGVDVASADFSNTIRLRIAAAIDAFYTVLEAQAMLDLAKENQDNLTKMEQIILNRVALGGVGTIEADRIRLSIFSSHREVHERELALNTALTQLRALMGIVDDVTVKVSGNLEVTAPIEPLVIDKAFALASENRPDLVSLQRQLEKAKADIALENTKALPEITPKIGYTRQFQEQAIGFPDVNAWGVGVDMSLPIFDRNQGNIAKAKSVLVQTQLNVQAQMVALRSEIDQAVKAYASTYDILLTDDPGQLEAAKNVRDKINQAYALGGKTLIEVLDAQRTYLDTFRLHISVRSNYWHYLYQLNAAIGKDVLH